MISVTIGPITFFAAGQPGYYGWYVAKNGLIDWYSGADSKNETEERPTTSGAFGIGEVLRSSKLITLNGLTATRDRSEGMRMKAQLAALGATSEVLMTVVDELGATSRWVEVRKYSAPEVPDPGGFDFAIDVLARDPLRYGPETSDSTGLPTPGTGLEYPIVYPISYGTPGDPGRITLSNAGTANAYTRLLVTGGLGGVELSCIETGGILRLERVIPMGSVVEFDSATELVTIDGQSDLGGYLTLDGWTTVPPSSSRTFQFAAIGDVTGTPTLTGFTADTYH